MEQMPMVIRTALADDVDAIVRLVNAGSPQGKARAELPVELPPICRETLAKIAGDPDAALVVALRGSPRGVPDPPSSHEVPRRGKRLRWNVAPVTSEQWVVLVHIDWPNCRTAEFRSAVVVGNAETRDAALDAARTRLDDLRDEFACFFTKRYIFWMRPNGPRAATMSTVLGGLSAS